MAKLAQELFSADYSTARARFREAALACGCELESRALSERGPRGEELAIDVATSPGKKPGEVLVISSGIHGVEGYFGSAVQLALLREWASGMRKRPTQRCVLMHALNPFGFAWRRRANEANVDLNRNFLAAGESYQGSPHRYRELDGLLNPKRAPSRWEPAGLKFLLAIARYGMPALKQAVAGGQYDFPRGLFYGGDRPSRTHEILAANFERWLDQSRRVAHLDLHTGLGEWASYKLLVDYPLSESQRERLRRWFGPASFEGPESRKVGYATRGSLGQWCVNRAQGRNYLYAAAEFGTYGAVRVLAGLRAENQAHHRCRSDDPATERSKRRLLELLCPRSRRWRQLVSARSLRLVDQALGYLDDEAGPAR